MPPGRKRRVQHYTGWIDLPGGGRTSKTRPPPWLGDGLALFEAGLMGRTPRISTTQTRRKRPPGDRAAPRGRVHGRSGVPPRSGLARGRTPRISTPHATTTSVKSSGSFDRGVIAHPPTDLLVEVIYERNESVHERLFAVTEIDELTAAIAPRRAASSDKGGAPLGESRRTSGGGKARALTWRRRGEGPVTCLSCPGRARHPGRG